MSAHAVFNFIMTHPLIKSSPFMSLHSIFPDLLAPRYLGWLVDGLCMTLWISFLVVVLSTFLGFFLAVARSSRLKAFSIPASAYTALFRNTTLLVQLFFWYFGIPGLLPEGVIEWLNTVHEYKPCGYFVLAWPSYEFLTALVGLILYSTAFVAEEIRSGMQGVNVGQEHAGQALGMTPFQVFRHIVAPQAVRIAMPPLLGQYMNIVKNSSLAMAIGLVELSYASRQVETTSFKTFQAFGVATIFYILIIAVLEGAGQVVQKRNKRLWGGR
jgi:polar amino acid transport system permease protein